MTRGKKSTGGKGAEPGPAATDAAEGAVVEALVPRAKPNAGAERDTLTEFFVSAEEQQMVAASYIGEGFSGTPGIGREMAELLAFWLADEEYAVDILEIQEIIKMPAITEVPRTPPTVLGIISLRGTIVPVLDLRRVLGLESRPLTRMTRILVLRADGDPVGLVVDRVTSVVRLDKEAIEPVPRSMQTEGGELLRGVGRFGERFLIIIDLPSILGTLESAA